VIKAPLHKIANLLRKYNPIPACGYERGAIESSGQRLPEAEDTPP